MVCTETSRVHSPDFTLPVQFPAETAKDIEGFCLAEIFPAQGHFLSVVGRIVGSSAVHRIGKVRWRGVHIGGRIIMYIPRDFPSVRVSRTRSSRSPGATPFLSANHSLEPANCLSSPSPQQPASSPPVRSVEPFSSSPSRLQHRFHPDRPP